MNVSRWIVGCLVLALLPLQGVLDLCGCNANAHTSSCEAPPARHSCCTPAPAPKTGPQLATPPCDCSELAWSVEVAPTPEALDVAPLWTTLPPVSELRWPTARIERPAPPRPPPDPTPRYLRLRSLRC